MLNHDKKIRDKFNLLYSMLENRICSITSKRDMEYSSKILHSIIILLAVSRYSLSRILFAKLFSLLYKNEANSVALLTNIILNKYSNIFKKATFNLSASQIGDEVPDDVNYKFIYDFIDNIDHDYIRISKDLTKFSPNKEQFFILLKLLNYSIANIPTGYSNKLITNIHIFLYMVRHGIKNYNYIDEFYDMLSKFLHALSLFDKQLARDIAEEIMLCAEKDNAKPLSYIILTDIYAAHKLYIETAIYIIASFTNIYKITSMPNKFVFSLLRSCVVHFRDLQLYDYAKLILADIIHTKSYYDSYSKRWTLYLLCSSKIKEEVVIDDIYTILEENQTDILKNDQEIAPWFSLISEVKKIHGGKANRLNNFYDLLKKNTIFSKNFEYFSNGLVCEDIRKSLNQAQYSRSIYDIAIETKTLYPLIIKALKDACPPYDYDCLLLCHYALSVPFSMNNIDNGDLDLETAFSKDDNFSNNYIKSIKDYFRSHTEFIYIFMFTIDNYISLLIKMNNQFKFYKNLIQYSKFEEANSYILQNITTAPPITILHNTVNLSINITSNNVIFFPSSNLSLFPYNLIKINDEPIINTHSVTVSFPSLFNPRSQSINYPIKIAVKIFDANDRLTQSTINKFISNKIVDQKNVKMYNENVASNILCFVGHGGINSSGNLEIDAGEQFIEFDNLKYYCKCNVAIFFVCYSGTFKQNIFSNNVMSLATDLIQNGIHHVIAPIWTLSANITHSWLKTFLKNLELNNDVSKSVYLSNNYIKSLNFYISDFACMHHFSG